MQAWWEVRGPLEPRIYWFRRGLVLVVLVLSVVAATAGIRSCTAPEATGVGSSPTPSGTPNTAEPSPSQSATPAPSESQPAPDESAGPSESSLLEGFTVSSQLTPVLSPSLAACQPGDLELAITGTNPLHAGQETHFDITITNPGQACAFNPAGQLQLVITSGNDQIWNTQQCASWQLVPDEQTVLDNNGSTSYSLPWPVKRAVECEISETPLGNGTYVATVQLGDTRARFVTLVE